MEDNREEQDRAKNKHTKARMIGKVIAGVLMLLSYVFVVSAFTIGACMLVVYFSGMIGWLAYLILATVTAVMVIAAIKGN